MIFPKLKSNVINTTNDNYISKLINDVRLNCSFSNADHINKIEKTATRLLLLNNIHGNIYVNEIKWTYLIKFSNTTIRIGDINLSTKETNFELPGLLQHSARKKLHRGDTFAATTTESFLSIYIYIFNHVENKIRFFIKTLILLTFYKFQCGQ